MHSYALQTYIANETEAKVYEQSKYVIAELVFVENKIVAHRHVHGVFVALLLVVAGRLFALRKSNANKKKTES